MKLRRTFPFLSASIGSRFGRYNRRKRARGFTLVEVLVSMTVLTIMVGMFGTMLVTVGQLWHDTQKRVNNFTKARAMLDLMAGDLQAGIFRSELADFPTSSTLAFYAQRPSVGSTSTSRDLSLIDYSLNGSTLQRSSQAVDWTDVVSFISSGTTFSPVNTATGVVDFKMLFLQNDGTLSSTYTTNTRAIGITLAVVDDQTLTLLNQAGKTTALYSALESNASLSRSVKADWEAYLNTSSMPWNNYPKSLGGGLKIFERYVYLPTSS